MAWSLYGDIGYGQETDKTTGLEVGADEYLTKPVDRAVQLEKVTALLAQEP